jgi:hypothetical protein
MKKVLFFAICSFFSLMANDQALSILEGIYTLEGCNPGSNKIVYHGEVVIESYGDNYLLTWKIGSKQIQTGIGILQNNVLSVSFLDLGGKGAGVVSYLIKEEGKLEGKWAVYGSCNYGIEYLKFDR